ncbi:hypothetical protein ACFCV3_13560 [Kribbella sp. NPDC056345]|uniref:hypothetical protein n=1 Tax=Kribbella sp. NPDC056345 TaxID=3345789 RepID=UPI0035DBDDCB
MLGRFTVRPADDGSEGFGVWDGAVNGWRASGIPDELTAAEQAVELEIQYDAHGPRPADAVRVLPSPQPVRRATWSEGQIEAWVRDTGTGAWYAKFRDPTGLVSLILGNDVRPINDKKR